MEDDKKLMWKAVEVNHVVQDEWIDFRSNKYLLPDGNVIGPVYNFSKHSFVVVVAKDTEGRYICVRQYRHGIDEVTTEFPAGAIEYKEKSDVPYITDYNTKATVEEAFAAAKRELKEETGYVSDNWQHLLTVPSNATISSSDVFVFAAAGCRKETSQHLDDTEFLNVVLRTEEELRALMMGGDFKQSIHIMAYYLEKDKNESQGR